MDPEQDPEQAFSPALLALMRMSRALCEACDRLADLAERYEDLSALYTDEGGEG